MALFATKRSSALYNKWMEEFIEMATLVWLFSKHSFQIVNWETSQFPSIFAGADFWKYIFFDVSKIRGRFSLH